jgi:hypothetical protein
VNRTLSSRRDDIGCELAGFREHRLNPSSAGHSGPDRARAQTELDPMLAGSFDEENVSKRREAIDNDIPVVLCLDICCLTWPIFSGAIDVRGAHARATAHADDHNYERQRA